MNVSANRLHDLSPMLVPDRDEGYLLRDVYEKGSLHNRTEIILDFGDCSLCFGVDIDTDEIVPEFRKGMLRKSKALKSLASSKPWSAYLGKGLGWTWLATNQQGYCDSAMLSFADILPKVLLHAIGSSVRIFVLKDLDETQQKPIEKKRKVTESRRDPDA